MIRTYLASRMRSPPLRLSALLIAIFTLASLIGFGIAYLVIRNDPDAVIEGQLRQTMASYLSITDSADLHKRLVTDAATVDPEVMIALYAPQNGPAIDKASGFPRISGLTIVSEAAIRSALQDMTQTTLTSRFAGVADPADDLDQIGFADNRMADAQAAAIAARRQVTADIAHDLKTPIQRVAIHLSQLQDGTSLTAEQTGNVETTIAETSAIVRTFQSLLQIAQIEGGSVSERFVPVDLARIAHGMVEVFEPDAEESNHALSLLTQDEGSFGVMGDRQPLGLVLVNLIENGLRHVPPGGAIEVALARTPDGGPAPLTVVLC